MASGDPDATSVVLWTRVSSDEAAPSVRWEVASDPGFAGIVAEGR